MKDTALQEAARQFGTPLYVYDMDAVRGRVRMLSALFGGRFGISYAIKANPNAGVLAALKPEITTFDASSIAEVQRALAAGMPAARISFSGPAKRRQELVTAVDLGVGELVLESVEEARITSALAQERGRVQPCLVRINPIKVPRKFGASMAGTASQFGIDEEELPTALPEICALPGIDLQGFHIYSGTNCLDAPAIAENFAIFIALFHQAQEITGIRPKRLIFGSGFGVPYLPAEAPLDHAALPALITPMIDALRAEPAFAEAECILELGRWLIAPCGWLLTQVIRAKQSRGTDIRACDAGFNNHLAACGMMGSVLRRNWVYHNISNPDGPQRPYLLVGPLCTSIDRLAAGVELPETSVGDILSIPNSGAYGLTASPTRFISHPDPREVLRLDGNWFEVSEILMNHPKEA